MITRPRHPVAPWLLALVGHSTLILLMTWLLPLRPPTTIAMPAQADSVPT